MQVININLNKAQQLKLAILVDAMESDGWDDPDKTDVINLIFDYGMYAIKQ